MVVLTLTAGITVFIVMQRQSEAVLAKSLALALQVRVERSTIHSNAVSTAPLKSRPVRIWCVLCRTSMKDTPSGERQADLLRATQPLVPSRFTAFELLDQHGNSVLRLGQFSVTPELRVPLITPIPSTTAVLLRDGGMRMRVDVDIVADGGASAVCIQRRACR